ncbi:MAG: ABC transporter permease, partial [Candidatus Hodarchaeota archaeon]
WNYSKPTAHIFEWNSPYDTLELNGSMVLCSAVSREFKVNTGSNISFSYPIIPGLSFGKTLLDLYWYLFGSNYTRAREIALEGLSNLIETSKESLSFSNETKETRYTTSNISVSGVSKEIWGSVVYTTVETLTSVMGLNIFRNSILNIDLSPFTHLILKVSQPYNITLLEEIKNAASELDDIQSIRFHYDFQESIETSMGFFNIIIGVFLAFASLLAGAAIFTTIYVNFQERQNEIATMLTLGLSDNEFLTILTIENLFQSILGILFGIPVGFRMSSWILDNILRLFYFEITILPLTWVILWGGVIVIVLLSQLPAFYRGIRLDLAVITKELSI